VTDPAFVMERIEFCVAELDRISKALTAAGGVLDATEEVWDELADATAEALKEEMVEAGRKGDPAEHVVVSATRRQNRAAWQEYRRAKRLVERLEKLGSNRRAQLSGWQSTLSALKDESYAPQDPAWSARSKAAT
jgi:hypothetical protein